MRPNPHVFTCPNNSEVRNRTKRQTLMVYGGENAEGLCQSAITQLFQLLQNVSAVSKTWKVSNVIPVPKKPGVKPFHDVRPVAHSLITVMHGEILAAISHHL